MRRAVTLLLDAIALFVDDETLAITLLLILALAAFVENTMWAGGPLARVVLVAGSVAALVENVARAARAARRQ